MLGDSPHPHLNLTTWSLVIPIQAVWRISELMAILYQLLAPTNLPVCCFSEVLQFLITVLSELAHPILVGRGLTVQSSVAPDTDVCVAMVT